MEADQSLWKLRAKPWLLGGVDYTPCNARCQTQCGIVFERWSHIAQAGPDCSVKLRLALTALCLEFPILAPVS